MKSSRCFLLKMAGYWFVWLCGAMSASYEGEDAMVDDLASMAKMTPLLPCLKWA